MSSTDYYVEKVRTTLFIISGVISILLSATLCIFIPVTMGIGEFFKISNRSTFPEIGSAFKEVLLYLSGNCVDYVDNSRGCNMVSLGHLFYDMPNPSSFPTKIAPTDVPVILATFQGQNPVIFWTLLISELIGITVLIMSIRSFKTTDRRKIMWTAGVSFVFVIFISITLGVNDYIYGNILRGALNRPMTVSVTINDQPTSLTGKPSDVGIHFLFSTARTFIISTLVLGILNFLVLCRWIFEGNKRKLRSSRIELFRRL